MRASLKGSDLRVRDVEASRELYALIPGAVLESHRPAEFALFRIGKSHFGLKQSKTTGRHLEMQRPRPRRQHIEFH
jgi:hypothetical protein